MRVIKTSLFALGLSLCATLVPSASTSTILAETLVIQNTSQFYSANKPQKGMTKDQVRRQYGEPIQSYAAVGEPPISRWKFDEFTVYFEYNHVIHAVNNRQTRSLR